MRLMYVVHMLRDLFRRTKKYLLAQGWKWAAPRLAAAATAIAGGYFVPFNVTTYVFLALLLIGGLALAGRAYSEAVSVANEANENAAKLYLRVMAVEKKLAAPADASPSPMPRETPSGDVVEARGRHAAGD